MPGCQKLQIVSHRVLYNCTHTAALGVNVKGLTVKVTSDGVENDIMELAIIFS